MHGGRQLLTLLMRVKGQIGVTLLCASLRCIGAVGLAVVQACRARGVSRIFAVDIDSSKFEMANKLGATDCINPTKLPEGQASVQAYIVSLTK